MCTIPEVHAFSFFAAWGCHQKLAEIIYVLRLDALDLYGFERWYEYADHEREVHGGDEGHGKT